MPGHYSRSIYIRDPPDVRGPFDIFDKEDKECLERLTNLQHRLAGLSTLHDSLKNPSFPNGFDSAEEQKVEETIERLKQDQKRLADGWEEILNSDGRDHDTGSSISRRENFIQQVAALDSRVGEVADRVIRIVGARLSGGGSSGPAGEDGRTGNSPHGTLGGNWGEGTRAGWCSSWWWRRSS
jgi:hypothetical protein